MASLQEQRFGKADMRQSKEIGSPRPVAAHGCQLNKGTVAGVSGCATLMAEGEPDFA
jgi:hypothetical protein